MVHTIALIGISGKLGRAASKALLEHQNIALRGTCRDISKLPEWLTTSSQATLTQAGPYDAEALRAVVRGSDIVICCYSADPETMLNGQKLLIDLCEEEGVPRYMASDFTTDYNGLAWGDFPWKEPMKHVKAYLDTKPKVKGVHILVGLFVETFLAGFGVWDPTHAKLFYWDSPEENVWDFTTYASAARLIAAVAMDPSASGTLTFQGCRLNTADIARDLESVYGIKTQLERRGSMHDLKESIGEGASYNMLAAFLYYTLSGKMALGATTDNSKYPVHVETMTDFLKRTRLEQLSTSYQNL